MTPDLCLIAFGYHDRASPRHRTVVETFRRDGWPVEECHTEVKGLFAKYRDLAKKYRAMRDGADSVLVTFPGHFLVPLAWWLTRRPRKRLFFDAFISLYDTEVLDRKRVSKWHPWAWMLFCIDWLSCHLADEILIDTLAHRYYFCRVFNIHPDRFRVIYVEAPKDIFTLRKEEPKNARPEIVFVGTNIPLQGLDVIGEAAKLLHEQGFDGHFTFVGPEKLGNAVRAWNLPNVSTHPFATLPEIAKILHGADLALGIFGTTEKAMHVIPHKVVDAVACGVPVITADSPAITERLLNHPLVHLVPAGDAKTLASRIAELARGKAS